MTVSPHLRGIVIAGALATLALALGMVTLAMNQSASKAAPRTILTLKQRHLQSTGSTSAAAATTHRAKAPRIDRNLTAALKAGLPRSVARALAAHSVVVVELTSPSDPVAELASGEAQAGAALADASYVSVDVDRNGGDASKLTRLLGKLPVAPAALVYQRPATLFVTLSGFNDRTTVQQAAASAALTAGGFPTLATAATEWASRAGILCRNTFKQIAAAGDAKTPAQLATLKTKFEAVSATFLARFKSLRPPAGEAGKVAQLNTLMAKNFAATDAMIVAASQQNAKAVVAAKLQTLALAPRIQALEQTLGATGCAEASA